MLHMLLAARLHVRLFPGKDDAALRRGLTQGGRILPHVAMPPQVDQSFFPLPLNTATLPSFSILGGGVTGHSGEQRKIYINVSFGPHERFPGG